MFEIELKEHGKVEIYFNHYNPAKLRLIQHGTMCSLKNDDGVIVWGQTLLHHNDDNKYDKEFGRKLSLTRAISGLSRAERTKVWAAYFEAKKVKV